MVVELHEDGGLIIPAFLIIGCYRALYNGGSFVVGLHVGTPDTDLLLMHQTWVVDGSAGYGGAVHVEKTGRLDGTNSTIQDNKATM